MGYAVWKDEEYFFNFGTIGQSEGKEIVCHCETYEEARIMWKFFYYT